MEKKKIKEAAGVGYTLVKQLHFTTLTCKFFFFYMSKFVMSYNMSSVQLDT